MQSITLLIIITVNRMHRNCHQSIAYSISWSDCCFCSVHILYKTFATSSSRLFYTFLDINTLIISDLLISCRCTLSFMLQFMCCFSYSASSFPMPVLSHYSLFVLFIYLWSTPNKSNLKCCRRQRGWINYTVNYYIIQSACNESQPILLPFIVLGVDLTSIVKKFLHSIGL